MLDGDSTVLGGDLDFGGHVVKAGEQAVIRRGGPVSRTLLSQVDPAPS